MNYMIICCHLENLNLSNFNTQNVINIQGMFGYCESLKNLNLANFITQNVKITNCMFFNFESLKNLLSVG